jgi:hypothetical protein
MLPAHVLAEHASNNFAHERHVVVVDVEAQHHNL